MEFNTQLLIKNIISIDVKVQSRRIQHCYEDLVIEELGSGNFAKNLNYKLFDAAFMHLVKHKFTGKLYFLRVDQSLTE